MPKGKKKIKNKVEIEPIETSILAPKVKSEKEKLQDVYQVLKDYKINSISDIENLLSRMQ